MSKIRVLSDHVANQIAAGEVVERPASVAKELVENSIDAGARRVEVDVEGGGRRLLRVADDGGGMTRDDAVLAFERHATSKITTAEDLERITTLGFRGEALASIASVARVELVTQTEDEAEGTRVLIEGGRMRDVAPAARARGTTIAVRDLFFNVPARRKFLRSEATESFHLTNLVTHYALAHPEIAFALTNNGREVLRAGAASDLRERAYQIFGAEFLEGLLEVAGGRERVARVGGYVSAPRERRTTRDAQYLFVNGRFVRDRLVARALSEGYRAVLPHGTYPAALLFLEVPPEEVDVNVHPAKTEVRFRRGSAVADAVRDAVRGALATGGFLRLEENFVAAPDEDEADALTNNTGTTNAGANGTATSFAGPEDFFAGARPAADFRRPASDRDAADSPRQASLSSTREAYAVERGDEQDSTGDERSRRGDEQDLSGDEQVFGGDERGLSGDERPASEASALGDAALPPLGSAAGLVREAAAELLTPNIRPLGQLEDSFIIASDGEGLLLIDQHAAHERILFDEYRRLEQARAHESQQLLVPETFDLTPAQAAAFDEVSSELERLGFGLMRLSGRTVAVRSVPADLPPADARNLLAEILDAVDAEKRGRARAKLGEQVAATLARHAAVKAGTPLTSEKMSWLIERLLQTSSPTTCPHGRPVILRLAKRDIERGFRRT
jgi:DNA mismatch repair protein MutL